MTFGNEMYFKDFLYLVLIRLKGEVNFFIREFLEVFYFPSEFYCCSRIFLKEVFEKIQFKFFQSLGIDPVISLYILYGWQ